MLVDASEVGEFCHARPAAGGPDVEEAEGGAGFVGDELSDGLSVDGLDDNGLGVPFFIGSGDGACFFEPFGGAADGASFDHCGLFAGKHGGEGVASFVLLGKAEAAATVVDAAVVFEFEVGIEDEDVWGGDGSIGFGDFLGFAIVEIGMVELGFFRDKLHVFKGVAVDGESELVEAEAFGGVAVDGDEADALVLELFDEGFGATYGGDGVGAVIGGEDDGGGFFATDIGEGDLLIIDVDELKVGCGGSLLKGDRGVVGGGHGGRDGEGAGGEDEWFHKVKFVES